MRLIISLLIYTFISFQTVLMAQTEASPTVICLATETEQLPIYLTQMNSKQSAFSKEYQTKLENILRFDLRHDGMSNLVACTARLNDLAKSDDINAIPHPSSWSAFGASYLIKIEIQNKELAARLFTKGSEIIKKIDHIELDGDLSRDRRKMHLLADTLHQALFNVNGIATTKILYTIKDKDTATTWKSELWECDYDGANARKLSAKETGYVINPVYMPPKAGYNCGTYFYVSYLSGQPKIYFQSLNEPGVPRRLNTIRGNQLMPAITKARDKIAFICDVTGNPDLFIQPFNPEGGPAGKPYQIFSSHLASQGTPTFSPDGRQIAFVSNKDGSPRIYVMNVPEPGTSLNQVKAKLVTKCNKESSAPAWSPDGTKLSYCSKVKGVRQLWLYDFSTMEEKQLTQGPNNKENPTWAPDSLHLAFNTSESDACDLYIVNLNQPKAIKITSGAGEKRFPSWEPRHE